MLYTRDVLTRVLRSVGLALVLATAAAALPVGESANIAEPTPAFVRVASPERRLRYLATAQIWTDPGEPTPDAVRAGPPLDDGSGLEGALDGHPFPCTFAQPGKTMGGATPKFMCNTAAGRTIRLKYTDPAKGGNREVFSAVAASRLLWALGFRADPIYPVSIDCQDCPEDPMSGKGPKARRSYLAIYQPRITEAPLVDRSEQNQGWRWGELDSAIDSLPAGELRARQRQHFDALTLAAVLLQHGDRKPEQQRLACHGRLNLAAGEIRPVSPGDDHENSLSVFFERAGAIACDSPDVTVQDIGATFGGAGRLSKESTAKMNLKSWSEKPVFHSASKVEPGTVAECRGRLTVSMAAGEGSLGDPRIGEAGRLFLLDRLRRLTDDHLRAIFTAARVEQMSGDHSWRDPESGTVHTGVDAWVAAFTQKVRQIEARSCAA